MKPIVISMFRYLNRQSLLDVVATEYDTYDEAVFFAQRTALHVPFSLTSVIDEHCEMSLTFAPVTLEQIRRGLAQAEAR